MYPFTEVTLFMELVMNRHSFFFFCCSCATNKSPDVSASNKLSLVYLLTEHPEQCGIRGQSTLIPS